MSSKPNLTSLADLTPRRAAPRPTLEVAPTPMPVPAAAAAPKPRQANRVKTVMVAGHFDADVSYAIRELCGQLTRQKGERVTVQLALAEALADWFRKHGALPPDGLGAK